VLGTHDFFHHKISPKSQIKSLKKAVILKVFNRQEKKWKNHQIRIFGFNV
jgi:hypothetical protein